MPPARGQGQSQRVSQQWNGGRTAGERKRPSVTDPGIRSGPLPQVRKGRPAADGDDRAPEGKWRPETSQLREGRRVAPSRGDVIEAEVADVNGRAAGKVMLEAIEVELAQEAGIFARVACAGVVDPELGDYAVSDPCCGEGSGGVRGPLLCASGTRKVWRDGSGSALREVDSFARRSRGRGVDAESAEASRRTSRGLRPEIAEAGPAFFGPTGGEGLEAHVAALAGELGLDPPVSLIEPKILNAPRSSQLEGRNGDLTPRGEAWGPSGRNKDVESRMSRDILPSAAYWTPPTASTPLVSAQDPPLEMVLQEKLKEARARLSRKRQGRTSSVGREGTRTDGRRLGNGGSGESTEEMQQRDPGGHEEEEPKRARPLKQANGGVQQQRRRPRKRRRVQGEAHCRHEARSASPLRPDHDAPPPGTSSRGLRRGGRGASDSPGGCLPRDSSEAECWEQAQFQNSSRVAVVSRSRRLADARSSGECRRRPDPEVSRELRHWRKGDGQSHAISKSRSGSLDSAIWSAGSDDQSRTGPSPSAPRSVEAEPKAGPRGERAAFARDQSWKSAVEEEEPRADRQRGQQNTKWRRSDPRRISRQPGPRRAKRPKQGKAKQVAVKGKAAPLVVCGAQRASLAEVNLGKELAPHSIFMERSWCS